MKASHNSISVECLFSMTLALGLKAVPQFYLHDEETIGSRRAAYVEDVYWVETDG